MTVCAECGTEPVPKSRRLFCSKRCYRRANSRQTHAARRERNQRKREQVRIVDEAVRALHAIEPWHGGKIDGWTLRWTWTTYRGHFYDEVGG